MKNKTEIEETETKCCLCGGTSTGEGQFLPSSFSMRDNMCDSCVEDNYADYDPGEHWTTPDYGDEDEDEYDNDY